MNSENVMTFDIEDADILGGLEEQNMGDTQISFEVNLDSAEEIDVPLTFFRLLIFIVGILGNLLVIFVILILAEYKKAVTHWYVLQLAIADSLFLLTLPLRTAEHLQSGWRYAAWMCKLKDTMMFLNYYSSICFLMVMSVDRYIAVCHWRPTSVLQKLRTPKAAGIITVCVWTGCLLMCLPVMLYSTTKGIKPHCQCQFVFPEAKNSTEDCLPERGGNDTEAYNLCLENTGSNADQDHCIDPGFIGMDFSGAIGSGLGAFGLGDGDIDLSILMQDVTTDSPILNEAEAGNVLHPGCHYFGYSQGYLRFLWFNFIGMFIIPLMVMIVCYAFIVNRLNVTRARGETVRSNSGSSSGRPGSVSSTGRKRSSTRTKSDRNRNRVTIMCASMVALFIVCWLPFHAVHLAKMKSINGTTEFCEKLSQIVSLIAFANSMLNPIIYNFVGTRFAKRLRRVRETRSVKALLHFTSGITAGNAARHNSSSANDQMHDKSSPKQRWRSELATGDRELSGQNSVQCKVSSNFEESRTEIMKKYPVYTGPTAQRLQQLESPSRSDPPPYQEQPSSITIKNEQTITEEATAKQEQ